MITRRRAGTIVHGIHYPVENEIYEERMPIREAVEHAIETLRLAYMHSERARVLVDADAKFKMEAAE